MSRSMRWVLLVAACMISSALLLAGCGGAAPKEAASTGGKTEAGSRPSLDAFLKANTMTADFRLTAIDAGETSPSFDATGTLWVQDRKFRYSLYINGKLLRTIMSPDGKTAYFVEEEGKYSEPSVASVDRYLLEFTQPGATSTEDGTDKETGAKRVVYTVKKIDTIAGADNSWYTEDVTYLVKDGEVIGTITRGDTPKKDGKPYELRTSRRIFSNLRVGVPIPKGTFELPYPIKNAK